MSPRRLSAVVLPLLAAFAFVAVPRTSATDYTTFRQDYSAEEAIRLINGERAFHGLRSLAMDKVLATKARDGAVACPNDTSKIALGRARDEAVSGVFSHGLRLCGTRPDGTYRYTVIDAMYMWGYNTYRGEIIAWNTYPVSAATYRFGCSLTGAGCSTTKTTTTPATVAAAMNGWMRSSGHRSLILGNYDRVGCGAWRNGAGVTYYSCLFSLGGPDRRDLTSPTVSSATGRGATVSGVVTFYATVADDFRLADGWTWLDNRIVSRYAFSLNVRSYRASLVVDTRRLSNGSHNLVWRARDVGTRTSAMSSGVVSFTVRNP